MNFKFVLFWLTVAMTLSGQIQVGTEISRVQSDGELYKQADVSAPFGDTLEQAEDPLGDARDRELLGRTLYKKALTEEEPADMEAPAVRRLERRKAHMAKLERLVGAGTLPSHAVDASLEEVDSAVKDYVLAVSRTALVHHTLGGMEHLEYGSMEAPSRGWPVIERFQGGGSFTPAAWKRVQQAYGKQFKKFLPVSAQGETAVHRALGYDHRGRVDVALFPDATEGLWLRAYLESNDIPYYAFRSFVPGKATAAHIHVGPPSSRLRTTE